MHYVTFMTTKHQTTSLNPKIILIAVIAAMAGAVAVFTFSGSYLIDDVAGGGFGFAPSPVEILPLEPYLETIEVLSISEDEAQVKLVFKIINPNYKSVLLQVVKYHLFVDESRVAIGEIGERPEGMVAGSNYYTILRDYPLMLEDVITIKNTGADAQLWSGLSNNDVNWTVKGELYFNLSSMTRGHENITPFELTP